MFASLWTQDGDQFIILAVWLCHEAVTALFVKQKCIKPSDMLVWNETFFSQILFPFKNHLLKRKPRLCEILQVRDIKMYSSYVIEGWVHSFIWHTVDWRLVQCQGWDDTVLFVSDQGNEISVHSQTRCWLAKWWAGTGLSMFAKQWSAGVNPGICFECLANMLWLRFENLYIYYLLFVL